MNRIKLTANLYLDEYIPKELYLKYESRPQVLIGLLDRRLVLADQKLRDVFGATTINNWWHGGDRQWSGLRTPDSPYYSPTSQHTFARASDKIYSCTAEEVRQYIKEHWIDLGITCIEDKVSWVHTDHRFNVSNQLLIVNP